MALTDGFLGNEPVLRYLQRVANADVAASGYLFVGPEGVGKHRLALAFAQALQCTGAGERACGSCSSCSAWTAGSMPDVILVSPDGGHAIGIGAIRSTPHSEVSPEATVLARVRTRPLLARRQVAIIDGADRLTAAAANALLKTLEEPAGDTHFLLTAEHPDAVLPTIVSRSAVLNVTRVPTLDLQRWLMDDYALPRARAQTIARFADGCPGRAVRAVADPGRLAVLTGQVAGVIRALAERAPSTTLTDLLLPSRGEETTPQELRRVISLAIDDLLLTDHGLRSRARTDSLRAAPPPRETPGWATVARAYRDFQRRLDRPGMARSALEALTTSLTT